MRTLFSRLKKLESLHPVGPTMTIICGHYFHEDGAGDYSLLFDGRIFCRPPVEGKRVVLKIAPGFDARFVILPGAASVTIEPASPDELMAWQLEHDIHEKVIAIDLRALCQEPPPVTEEEANFVMQSQYLQASSWKNSSYEQYIEAMLEWNRQEGLFYRDCDWPKYVAPVHQAEQAAPVHQAAPAVPELTPAEIAEQNLDRHFKLQLVKQRQARQQKNSGYYK